VNSVREMYQQFRHLIHEGAKFLTLGLVGTIDTFGLANALNHRLGKYGAITVATIVATVVTFLGNRHWTFRHREGQGTTRDTVVFFVLNGIGLLIYYACIGITDLAGLGHDKLWYNAALVVGTVLGTLFRFWSYRKWVWTAKDAELLASGEPEEVKAQDLAAVLGAAPVSHAAGNHASGNHSSGSHSPGSHASASHAPAPVASAGRHRR